MREATGWTSCTCRKTRITERAHSAVRAICASSPKKQLCTLRSRVPPKCAHRCACVDSADELPVCLCAEGGAKASRKARNHDYGYKKRMLAGTKLLTVKSSIISRFTACISDVSICERDCVRRSTR